MRPWYHAALKSCEFNSNLMCMLQRFSSAGAGSATLQSSSFNIVKPIMVEGSVFGYQQILTDYIFYTTVSSS